ncbi:MAG: chemotaxis protein CheA [Proteobacteria bacterium]|nr:chemotaxis protein CheA [Pseudomonadota bacterium]
MDDFELELKTTFIDEAILNLEEVEGCFMELEGASDPKDLLDKIFRLAHNLKGGSRSVGFGDVATFTHEVENLVLALQKGKVTLTSEVVSTLLQSNDRLVEMMHSLKQDMSATFNNDEILIDIRGWVEGRTASEAAPKESPVVAKNIEESTSADASEVNAHVIVSAEVLESTIEASSSAMNEPKDILPPNAASFFADDEFASSETSEVPGVEQAIAAQDVASFGLGIAIASAQNSAESPAKDAVSVGPASATTKQDLKSDSNSAQKSQKPQASVGKTEKEDEVVRVSLSRIELLNDYVGELIVLQSVIQQQSLRGDPLKLQNSIQEMVKLSKEIQNLSMGLRMLPVKPLVQKLQRVVRDTATTLGKNVRLDIQGDQMDVDKSVLDQLGDPLIHILRNAVDHGLETTDERATTSKDPQGVVRLAFQNEGNHLIVEIRDDGKGINTEIVRKKAIEKKLVSANENLTEKQIINLIFHPGFSTKAVTSEVSGRGVGMDVVKTNVEKIGGQVDVTTELGHGSVFRLKIPLSLAVVEGLVMATNRGRFVIPLSQVHETVNLDSVKVHPNMLGIGDCMELRGEVVPIFRLEKLLEPKREESSQKDSTALLFAVEERMIAVSVKELLHSQQVVIKPLNNGVQAQTGWIGSCVLGDGLPTLILNPVELLEGKVGSAVDQLERRKSA